MRLQAEGRALNIEEGETLARRRAQRLRFPDSAPDPRGTNPQAGPFADAHAVLEEVNATSNGSQRPLTRWLTAEYRMGDVLVFSMYTMHASTDNQSESAVRLSSDTRYQLASEPADARSSASARAASPAPCEPLVGRDGGARARAGARAAPGRAGAACAVSNSPR